MFIEDCQSPDRGSGVPCVDPEDPNWSSPLDRNGLFGYGHPSRLPTQLPPGADGDGGTGTVPCGIQRAPI